MAKRAAAYGRVSTDDQRDNYSIPTQIDACLARAREKGYTIVGDQFIDSYTGQDVSPSFEGAVRAYVDDYTSRELSRPSLDAALKYLEEVGFDVLIVYAIDRLARDPYIRQTLEMEFERRGAKVEYVSGDYDDSPEGEVRKDLDATFAKWENAKRVERCNRGKRRKAENGLFVAGRPPFGYIVDKTVLGGLAINEEQASLVRRIFRMYVEGRQSLQEIARTLTQERVPTYRGGSKWAKSSVKRILTNSTYVGRGFYNKFKRNGKRLEKRDRKDWIPFETTPIVERWLFDEAQRRLDESGRARRRKPTRFYLLSGMIFCGKCERPYGSQAKRAGKDRRKNDAQLYRHRKKAGHCCNHVISARRLEPLIWNEIVAILMNPERLWQGYENSLVEHERTMERQKAHLATLWQRVKRLEQKRRNLTGAYTDPEIVITKEEYLELKTQIDDELEEVKKRIERVEKELASIPTPADLETLEAFASTIKEVIIDGGDDLKPEEKRRVLELLHVKITINKQDETFRIDGWFGKSVGGLSYTTQVCSAIPSPSL